MTSEQAFVIVGASLAGAKAAETLRGEAGRENVSDAIQQLIRQRVPVDDRRLVDPDVPLDAA